jgi:hypothetical protein
MFSSELNVSYRYGVVEDLCCVENQDKIGDAIYSYSKNTIRILSCLQRETDSVFRMS